MSLPVRLARRALGASLALASIGALVGGAASAAAKPSTTAAAAAPSYMTAAEYFGSGNPTNMWSSDLSGAPREFRQMKGDGFNTVGLVVPWGEFETGVTPVKFDKQTFSRLDQLISDATRLGMDVILRLSYEWDANPSDQMPGLQRFNALWSQQKVLAAWLSYIGHVYDNVKRFKNVRGAYLSWEDLWQPVYEAQSASTTAKRLTLAKNIGYRTWLRSTDTLAQAASTYGTSFSNWSQVPTPPATQPSFRLMYQFEDATLIHRLFLPASKRFPGLTMETRVDVDPLYSGPQQVGGYQHTSQYQLPGTPVTGIYFSPYMNDPASTHVETAPEATAALNSVLSKMSGLSGGRPLDIYEYEIESNSPQVATDPALTPNQIPSFVAQSEPLLRRYTAGYALWTYRDYVSSPFYNQSFALGSVGWKLSGSARPVAKDRSKSYLAMSAHSKATQAISTAVSVGNPATFSVEASAPRATTLTIRSASHPPHTVRIKQGWHTYRLTLATSPSRSLSITANGKASISQVQLSSYTQLGDIYSVGGQPEIGAAPIRALNKALTTGS